MRIRYVCEKGNIAGRGRRCRQNLCRGKTTSDNVGEKPTYRFSLQHNTFTALNYAQDFGTTVKESLKTGAKVELSCVKYFQAFVSTLNYVSPIGANSFVI